MEFGILSLIPPILALVIALWFKNINGALLAGLFSAYMILNAWNPVASIGDSVMAFVNVFQSTDTTLVIIDTLLLGGLLTMIEHSGGISGLVEFFTEKTKLVKSKKGAQIFAWAVGVAVFFSDTLSCLITGAIAKPVDDAFHVSKEKQAFIVHTTSTAVCMLLPLSGWGGYLSGILQGNGVENGMMVLFQSIPFNFFCILVVFAVPIFALLGFDFGPMKKAELAADTMALEAAEDTEEHPADYLSKKAGASAVILPLGAFVVTIIAALFITGNGSFFNGYGLKALFYGDVIGILTALIMYTRQKLLTREECVKYLWQGAGNMMPVDLIICMAVALSSSMSEVGTAEYIIHLFTANAPIALFPVSVFLMACIMAFATGSSMGTMAMVAAIAIPAALEMSLSIPLVSAAVWGGAVFGDQSSPISDTTVLTCSAIHCDPMKHVQTQLPYTIILAVISAILYLICGFVMY